MQYYVIIYFIIVPAHESSKVLMILGGGHEIVNGDYFVSEVTKNRASAAADYYDAFPEQDITYLFSGYYGEIATRGQMVAPPRDRAEAVLAEQVFIEQVNNTALIHGVSQNPKPRTVTETTSIDTYTNFIDSIEAGHLQIGRFSPNSPLLLSTERQHAWRSSVIATQALALPEDSLVRLPVRNARKEFMVGTRERLLLAVTRLALADIGEISSAEPGNMVHTKEAGKAFAAFSQQPAKAVKKALKHPSLWKVPNIPQLLYPVR